MPNVSSRGKQLAVAHWIEDARPGHQRWDYVGDGNGLPPECDDAIPVHEWAEELTVRTALGLRAAKSRAGSLLSLVLDLLGDGHSSSSCSSSIRGIMRNTGSSRRCQ